MDYLHMKAASDLHRKATLSDDEFYTRHSCTWLQGLKRTFLNVQQANAKRTNAQNDLRAKDEVKAAGY